MDQKFLSLATRYTLGQESKARPFGRWYLERPHLSTLRPDIHFIRSHSAMPSESLSYAVVAGRDALSLLWGHVHSSSLKVSQPSMQLHASVQTHVDM